MVEEVFLSSSLVIYNSPLEVCCTPTASIFVLCAMDVYLVFLQVATPRRNQAPFHHLLGKSPFDLFVEKRQWENKTGFGYHKTVVASGFFFSFSFCQRMNHYKAEPLCHAMPQELRQAGGRVIISSLSCSMPLLLAILVDVSERRCDFFFFFEYWSGLVLRVYLNLNPVLPLRDQCSRANPPKSSTRK
ncbi:hypothetical protein LY78DRAFT_374257 [Colletotrichum sublineola]|nr:hypothetical protein LY78DRAFT_374257 [Colletotrichum sublineola]